MVDIQIQNVTQADIDEYNASGLNGEACMNGRKKLLIWDENHHEAVLYVDDETIDKLGYQYLCENITLRYSKITNEWYANLSQNNYFNEINRFPEKIIEVKFVENKNSDGSEIYRAVETGNLYQRQVSNRESFAKWYSVKTHSRYQYIDIGEIRANIIFKHGNQTEKVTYDDWNGNAAYSNTFNKDFFCNL